MQPVFYDTGAIFYFDGQQMDSSQFSTWPNSKCLRLQPSFTGTLANAQGHLYLSVKFPNAIQGNGNKGISHVVAM